MFIKIEEFLCFSLDNHFQTIVTLKSCLQLQGVKKYNMDISLNSVMNFLIYKIKQGRMDFIIGAIIAYANICLIYQTLSFI